MSGPGRQPRVSVVTPFLDPPPAFFREAIESVLAQTFAGLELLLVDDGSSPEAAAVAREYAARDPDRVRCLAHPGGANHGPRAARRLGVENARGHFIALLDADDMWLPTKLEEQVPLLERRPDAGMLYGNSLYWYSWADDPPHADFTPRLGVPPGEVVQPPHLLVKFLSGTAAVPCPSSVLARRHAILDAGAFEGEFLGLYEDQVFFAIMCLHAPAVPCAAVWDRYRQHGASSTSATARLAERKNRRQFLHWLDRRLDESGVEHTEVRRAIHRETWLVDHPVAARVLRGARSVARRLARPEPRAAARIEDDR